MLDRLVDFLGSLNLEPRHQEIEIDNIAAKEYLPASYEGCVVRIADRIAYLGRDRISGPTAQEGDHLRDGQGD